MTENISFAGVACMGGWCKQRDKCARYYTKAPTHTAERLCPTGHDNPLLAIPVVVLPMELAA